MTGRYRHRHGPPWSPGRAWHGGWPPASRSPGGWPPAGRPPYGAPFWQRRFLRFAIAVGVIWIGAGIVFGLVFHDRRGDEMSGPPSRAIIPVVVAAAVIATVVAYRRIARPISSLLGSAARVGDGDYGARVRPAGPRSVQALGHAFNDMAARLDASDSARRRFLADVTHELRTPLTVLQAAIEAQLDGIHPRDDDHVEMLLEQTRTLARLVDDLRTLALSDAGQLRVSAEPTALDGVVAEAVTAMQPMAAARGVSIVVTDPVPSVTQLADRTRLVQVLTNVLTNAVRHTPAGGTVTVSLTAERSGATITLDDTGPGIDGDPERLFDRFHRSADTGGSGLGLTIARQLVVAHGGTITAANRPGPDGTRAGARFTVSLPAGDVLA